MPVTGIPTALSASGKLHDAQATILQNEQPSVSLSSILSAAMSIAENPLAATFAPKSQTVVLLEGDGDWSSLVPTVIGGNPNIAYEINLKPDASTEGGKSFTWSTQVTKPAECPQAIWDLIKSLVDPVKPTYTAASLMSAIVRAIEAQETHDPETFVVGFGQGGDTPGIVVDAATAKAEILDYGEAAVGDDGMEIKLTQPQDAPDPTALPFEGGAWTPA